jgi:hypothetical protein
MKERRLDRRRFKKHCECFKLLMIFLQQIHKKRNENL